MAIINSEILTKLRTTIRGEFNDSIGKLKPESFHNRVATTIPSGSGSNTYGFLGSFPKFRKWSGQRELGSIKEGAYTLQNEPYESTLEVLRTDIEDDNLGVYRFLTQREAQAGIDFLNINTAALLSSGDKTLCYDGQNFFDTEHKVYAKADGTGNASSVSNIYGSGTSKAWFLLDLSKPLKPLLIQERTPFEIDNKIDPKDEHAFMYNKYLFGAYWRGAFGYGHWQQALMSKETLTADSFAKAFAQMRNITRDGGDKMGIKPTHMVVPADLQSEAESIIKVAITTGGAGNIHYNKVEIIVCDWL